MTGLENPFSNSQYLLVSYIFKNFLCGPGFVAAKCPRTLALDLAWSCAGLLGGLPQGRAPVRATKLQYLAHRGVWMGVLRGPVELVISLLFKKTGLRSTRFLW